jgi:protein-S-isoprenylcysteine O-methyltransferase Ste14
VAGTLLIDPTLVQERIWPGPGGKDYGTVAAASPLMLGQSVVAGLDVGRFHWSDGMPLAVQGAGLLAVAAALAVVVWAMAINRFFSSVIRIQTDRGHHLVTSGPYRYVQHPAYAAFPFLMIGSGSWFCRWCAAPPWRIVFCANSWMATLPMPGRCVTACSQACGDWCPLFTD